MEAPEALLRQEIRETLDRLRETGRPSRTALVDQATRLINWRRERNIPGIWPTPPLMITATIDDGWGHGLEVIHLYAEAMGVRLLPLGLLQSPEAIIARCREHRPELLGLTVLQFDSEEALKQIRDAIPPDTRIIAGGPLFRADPDLAARAGIDVVAANAIAFTAHLMGFERS